MSFGAPDQNSNVQKHRACDECRIRKLACSKEPNGCCRCRRENIPCHYSPQKPMGRPRKRMREGPDEEPAASVPPTKIVMTEQPPDVEGPGMDFIDFILSADDFDMGVPPYQTATITTENPIAVHAWGTVDFDSQPAEHERQFTFPHIDPAIFPPIADYDSSTSDQLSAMSSSNSDTASSTESSANPTVATASVANCDCIAELYSALNSMQNVPTEVESAIRHARLAAKVAYNVVNCSKCSFRLELPAQNYARSAAIVQSFQTLMLLATLIPSIVHAYAQMLAVVDEETNRAIAERRNIVFKLDGLGGMWGCPGNEHADATRRNFSCREMEPALWRLTVRALMKLDVYGLSSSPCAESAISDPFHLGLKDLVSLMENKSKERHAFMDAMVSAGVWQAPNCGFSGGRPGEPATCQRVISIARSSVEQLYIA
ncbi:hypothetical protein F4861DRAFT_505932 [Xylaria intraflava]|nr:hypothetical protein F4861DRAFT_505932 [Xylaria intraflava]